MTDDSQTQILAKIKEVVADQLDDVNVDEIQLNTNLKDGLDLDSLDIFEIVDALEDEYDIEIDGDEGIETVQQLVDYVQKQINEK
ncbi:acyl carrier protein [Fructilactobacillus sanfranciscensis]|uniref:Acyl carrier protein n=1 Tax=Fructilactobacillus sanfranciscensis (strain TMW 1.1304) TaxID=714313 RepID=G2KWQ2_FRUST|nr:acyl carrier protein [Fructilactobacillus sanfranciscensis]AEN99577.1 Acyl carrier protein [Fructilactobacillus sanfranciscensis TMW 1.1304]KRM80213.1 acyl carrier protein [Fructilactobacillus sanfranciscensis DSM 20451]MCG7194910.1 acyl carrier protein [Fructilactobacillus sanfranciscensis]MCG7196060.1 acyl carrier protein [Fructilactobacillus sanfranciscensis]MDN4462015.1 acyl carrier protein [Fructilactobacillus sanfranciscensis]